MVGNSLTFRFVLAILASFLCILHKGLIGQIRRFGIVSYLVKDGDFRKDRSTLCCSGQ